MFVYFNPNPYINSVGDCIVRGLAKALNKSWDDVYWGVCYMGFLLADMPSGNRVWGEYLMRNGFERYQLPNTCPACYTVKQFCHDNPYGTFVLATGSHAICVIDGNYYDSWDSGDEVPICVYRKKDYK